METGIPTSRLRNFAAALCRTHGMQITELTDDDRFHRYFLEIILQQGRRSSPK